MNNIKIQTSIDRVLWSRNPIKPSMVPIAVLSYVHTQTRAAILGKSRSNDSKRQSHINFALCRRWSRQDGAPCG